MRLYHSIFFLLLLLGADGFAQGQSSAARPPLTPAAKDSLVKHIRAVFQRINSDTTLQMVYLNVDEWVDLIGDSPDNGAEVNGYFRKDTIYKLHLSVGPSFGMNDYEYYFERGQIVFIYEKDKHYPPSKDGEGLDHDKMVTGLEARFYFNKGKLISKIVKRYDHFMAQEIDGDYIKKLLDVAKFVEQLRKHLKH